MAVFFSNLLAKQQDKVESFRVGQYVYFYFLFVTTYILEKIEDRIFLLFFVLW